MPKLRLLPVIACLSISHEACTNTPRVESSPTDETLHGSTHPTPESDEYGALAADLAACLGSCRVESQENYRYDLSRTAPSQDAPPNALILFRLEGECREKCLSDYGSGLRCRSCARHIEARECVYGSNERCRWSLADGQLSLSCCRREGRADPLSSTNEGAAACPSSALCP